MALLFTGARGSQRHAHQPDVQGPSAPCAHLGLLFAVLTSAFSTWAAFALTHASSIHCLVLSLRTLFDQVRYTSTTLSKIQPASHNGLVLHWRITHYTDNSSTKMSSPSAFQRAAVISRSLVGSGTSWVLCLAAGQGVSLLLVLCALRALSPQDSLLPCTLMCSVEHQHARKN